MTKKIYIILKILVHIAAITCFLIGIDFIHAVVNGSSQYFMWFDISLSRPFVFDLGIVLEGCGFFIEFFLTFKPIEVK